MSGLYIHIPFCHKACHYCDFHFSTSQSLRERLIYCICLELIIQKDYLNNEKLETVYFGGGTPSILSEKELISIFDTIHNHYKLIDNAEITLEANPDDLTSEKLKFLFQLGINRLSIGIQSFNDGHLKFLNRSHTSVQANEVVDRARKVGFQNISLDLIYSIPAISHKIWEDDIKKVLNIRPEHISAYCLTIEEKTAFGNWLKKGKLKQQDDEFAAIQYEMLLDNLENAGYEQYEVSNFSLPLYHSKHNSNYWKQKKYLGIGPGAHSFNDINRQFNISNNSYYIKAVEKGKVPFEVDVLKPYDRINEYILTSLRTKWGLNLEVISKNLDKSLPGYRSYIQTLVKDGMASINNETLILSKKGLLFADKIASDLFIS